MMKNALRKLIAPLEKKPRLVIAVCVAAVLCIQYVQLQYSADWHISNFFLQRPVMYPVNLALLLALSLTLKVVLQRWDLTLLVSCLVVTLWCVVNYFTIMYHGSPLYVSEFRNAGTALNVMDSYSYTPDLVVAALVLAAVIELLFIAVIHALLRRRPRRFSWARFGITLGADAALVGCLFALLFGPAPVKPRDTSNWTWRVVLPEYGYVSEIVEDLDKMLNPLASLVVPDGYDAAAIDSAPADGYAYAPGDDRPDIILILNETFCDLSLYSDVEADHDYLADFRDIDGAVYGAAIVPNLGGGTNNSEFELLTGGSMYLLTTDAPFNYLDLSADTAVSAVRYLKELGYASAAFHIASPGNYSRNIAYPALGFDTVLMGDAFDTGACYGDRWGLDAEEFRSIRSFYDTMGDGPRFIYHLTYQNHGGYEHNEPSWDTVRITNDYGELTDDIEEYLTSIELSSRAFRELTEMYKDVDRRVIICMVGDHAPAFVSELSPNREMSGEEASVWERAVPYVIWSNYDAALPEDGGLVAMFDLMPMTMQSAGLPLSDYYRTILALHENVPVLTRTGLYMDADGSVGATADSPFYDDARQYYYMEYNALRGGADYRADIFAQ